MGKNWAITVGINQYYNLQQLNFAQQDAEAMRDFFLREIGFEQVYHFSNESAPIQADSGPLIISQPTYGTLKRFLRVRFEQPFLTAGDNFWFFFAGHGLFHEGQDYLMPIDADPGNVEETALPVKYVTEQLRRCGADNVVLFLDACRNRDRSGRGVGSAQPQGVVTFFSCNPRERSYEIDSLSQGAFTYALLEGMRIQGAGNCATVERLDQYLRYQVPQLNQRHDKPRQTPYTSIEPITKQHLILLPQQATLLSDVMALKNDALEAEAEGQLQLAEQFWIRVLAVSPADQQAIKGIKRLARRPSSSPETERTVPASSGRQVQTAPVVRPQRTPPPRQAPPPRQQTPAPVRRPSPPAQKKLVPSKSSVRFGRRRLIQIAGGTGGAIVLGWVVSWLSSNKKEVAADFSFEVVSVDRRGNETQRSQGKATGFAQPLGEDVRLEMVSIPGGKFLMGSPADEPERRNDESSQHQVTVPAFFIGRYAVTQAQWRAVAELPQVERKLIADPSRFKGAERSVENVSWLDAVEFCKRLSQTTGRDYRLPSEAEWEYACRAGTKTPFHFGETITPALANYRGTSTYGDGPKGEYRGETTPVGSFGVTNAFGLYDMHGNVLEWCADQWHGNYEGAPNNGSAWIDNENDNYHRLLRGGSWDLDPEYCRSAVRGYYAPVVPAVGFGLRVACSGP